MCEVEEPKKEKCTTVCVNYFFDITLLVMIVLIVVTLLITVFMSTMIFVYSVITTLVYRMVGLFYSFSIVLQQKPETDNVFILIANSMWFFYSIPLVSFILSIVYKYAFSFFKDLGSRVSPSVLFKVVNSTKGDGKRTSLFWLTYFGVSFLALISVTVITVILLNLIPATSDSSIVKALTTAICILLCLITVYYFFKVIFTAWCCMFRTEPKDRAAEEQPLFDLHKDNENTSKANGVIDKAQEFSESIKGFYDPVNLLSDHEWTDYMKDAEFNVFLYGWRMKRERLFGIAIFLLVIVMKIFTVIYIFKPNQNDTSSICYAGFHLIFYILCLPFLVICNISSLFLNFKKLAKYPNIRLLTIATMILFGVIVLGVFIVGIVFSCSTVFAFPTSVRPYPIDHHANYTVNVNINQLPPMCSINYNGISLITLTALLAAAYELKSPFSKEYYKNYTTFNNMKDIFLKTNKPKPIELKNVKTNFRSADDDHILIRYDLDVGETIEHIVAVKGITTTINWAYFVDLFVHSFLPIGLEKIIPFFPTADSLFLHRPLLELSYYIQRFFGIDSASTYFSDGKEAFSPENLLYEQNASLSSDQKWSKELSIIGHTIGGTFAKVYSLLYGYQGFAFESLRIFGTFIETKYDLSNPKYEANKEKMINFYSSSNLMAEKEDKFKINIDLPNSNSKLNPPGPFDSLCNLVAMCSTYKVHYDFCDDAMTYDKFSVILKNNNRTRDYVAIQEN